MRSMRSRSAALFLGALLLAACGGDGGAENGGDAGGSPDDQGELIVQAANYDLAAGEESRFIVGLLTPDQLFVSFGEVDVEFFYLGTREGEGTAEEGPTARAGFLPIEGEDQDGPVATTGSEGRGVYSTDVTFDRAGFWAAQVTAEHKRLLEHRAGQTDLFVAHGCVSLLQKALIVHASAGPAGFFSSCLRCPTGCHEYDQSSDRDKLVGGRNAGTIRRGAGEPTAGGAGSEEKQKPRRLRIIFARRGCDVDQPRNLAKSVTVE